MKIDKTRLTQIIEEEVREVMTEDLGLGKRLKSAGQGFMQEPYADEGAYAPRDQIIFQKRLYDLIKGYMADDAAVEVGLAIEDTALLAGVYLGDKEQASFDMRNERGDFDELKKELGMG